MTIPSQIEEKKPRKYAIVSRTMQAKILEESHRLSQRDLAEKYDVPRTTLENWLLRKKELKGKMDPNVVNFFESFSGQAWLHRMMMGVFLIFHQNGNSGIPDLHEFFEMTGVSKFVGTSVSALQKISKTLDKLIINFGENEGARLAQKMPHKNIPGALDENFIMDAMTLILMEPISNFILAEQIEEKRDAGTWYKVTQAAIKGLNVTICQLVGDEAAGLTKLATKILNVIKGPDLFHIQQEITKGLTSHLARTVQQVKKKQEDLKKEKAEMFNKFGRQLERVEAVEDLSKRGITTGKRVLEIEKEEKACQKKIEETESRYKTAQESRREITNAYHPFSLETGEKQTPEETRKKLEKYYSTLKTVAKEADCTDKQNQKIKKSEGAIGSMISVLIFFFSFLALTIKSLGLDGAGRQLFEKLVSIEYLTLCLRKSKKKKQKDSIRATLEKLIVEFENDPLWVSRGAVLKVIWRQKALECAQVFQRSSSCVEGRNGQLSLKFHAFRRINTCTLNVLTVLHNFFIRRADGTTAAERFFEQKPQDLFVWLLDKVELPRPRKKHKRESKKSTEKLVA